MFVHKAWHKGLSVFRYQESQTAALCQALQLLSGMVNQEGQSLTQQNKGPNSSEPSKVQEFDLSVSMGFGCTVVPSCVPVFTFHFDQDFGTGDVSTGQKGSDMKKKNLFFTIWKARRFAFKHDVSDAELKNE